MNIRIVSMTLLIICQLISTTLFADDNSDTMRALRAKEIKSGAVGKTINEGAENPKAVVWVITDLNCRYCTKIHQEVEKYKDLGIQLRFILFPRQGLGSPGYNKLVAIWNAKDPAAALHSAMQGQAIPSASGENPVKSHMALGRRWRLEGTPTVVFEDGTLWSGYYSPEKLAREAIKRSGA